MLWWTSSLTSNIHLQNGVPGRMLIVPDLWKHDDIASHQSIYLGKCVLNIGVQFPFYGVITLKPWRYFKICELRYKRATWIVMCSMRNFFISYRTEVCAEWVRGHDSDVQLQVQRAWIVFRNSPTQSYLRSHYFLTICILMLNNPIPDTK